MDRLKSCKLCPRACGVDRTAGQRGYCRAGERARIARAALHYWEEPCISGKSGSGAVFFSYCAMRCIFCQNYSISALGRGHDVTEDELSKIFLELRDEGACNINLVTPTHFTPQIINAIKLAKAEGLDIPIVYNCGGYESVETLKSLEGLIDIYLPDFKYMSGKYAAEYSNAPEYPQIAKDAVAEMVRQTGPAYIGGDGLMKRGTLVRHLMLPGLLNDSKRVVDYLYTAYGNDIYISLMSQYTPLSHIKGHEKLDRRINRRAYDALVNYCAEKGIEQMYIQDSEAAQESFIPEFE